MGMSTISLGEECKSKKKKGEEICMAKGGSFRQSCFLHEQQVEQQGRRSALELEKTMEGRILEHFWS
jgi:hypothetical protein